MNIFNKEKVKALTEENNALKIENERLEKTIAELRDFSNNFREFYDNVNKPIFCVYSNQTTTLTQTYTLNPYDRTPVEYIKNTMARDLVKAASPYIEYDVDDSPMGDGNIVIGRLTVVNRGVTLDKK